MAKLIEFWTGSHGETIVVAGSTIDYDPDVTAAVQKLGHEVPFNGDPSIAELETDIDEYFGKQLSALDNTGTEAALRPYLDGKRRLDLPFNVIAVGGKAAVALSLSEVPLKYYSQSDVLGDALIRASIDEIAGDHAAIMFPTLVVEDYE